MTRALAAVVAALALTACRPSVLVVAPDFALQHPVRGPLETEVGRIRPRARLVSIEEATDHRGADSALLLFGADVADRPEDLHVLVAEFELETVAAVQETLDWLSGQGLGPPLVTISERDRITDQLLEPMRSAGRLSVIRAPSGEDPIRTAERVRQRASGDTAIIVLVGDRSAAIAAGIDPDDGDAPSPIVAQLPFAAHGHALRRVGINLAGAIVYDLSSAATLALAEVGADRPNAFQVDMRFVRY